MLCQNLFKPTKLALTLSLLTLPAISITAEQNDLGDIEVIATKTIKTKPDHKQTNNKKNLNTAKPNKKADNDQPLIQATNSLPGTNISLSPNNNSQSVADLMQTNPNTAVFGGPRQVAQSISINGLDNNRVVVAVDGVNNQFAQYGHNQTRLLPDTFFLKQISINPSGSDILYGSGNLGGSVTMTTIDPNDLLKNNRNFGAKATFGLESGAPGFNSGIATALKTGDVSYLVAFDGNRNSNIHQGNGETLANSAGENLQGLGKINWQVTPGQLLSISFLSMQNLGQYPATTDLITSSTTPPSDFNYTQTQFNLNYDLNPKDNPYLDFKAKAYQLKTHFQSNPLNDGGGYTLPQDVLTTTTGTKIYNTSIIYNNYILYGISADRIIGQSNVDNGTTTNYPNADQNQYALFLQDRFQIFKNFALIVGGRYDTYNSQSMNLTNSDHHFSKQLTFDYQVIKQLSLFGGYTESFRAPSIEELYLNGTHPGLSFLNFLPNPDLKPEISHNKEVGFSYQDKLSNGSQVHLKTSFFYNTISNYIMATSAGSFPSITVQNQNVSSARIYGFTVTSSYDTNYFGIAAGFNLTQGNTQSSYTDGDGNTIQAGDPLPISPAKGFIQLTTPIKQLQSKISIISNFAMRQDQIPTGYDVDHIAGYTTFGFKYIYSPDTSLKGLQVIGGVDNIFDKQYIVYGGESTLDAMGRSFYVQLNYQF
ncbi:TonB-dependent receptor [Thiotrichales bacterium 19S3-7]|nr:TonB-dependent receptor [Thiotrichales bacterium 19S3-7]MCF6802840.1 TonB-dependent receptor [Thiotrichales bacterium 19S3-11]